MRTILTLFLTAVLMAGCRTMHRQSTSADSTVTRSAETGEQWHREIIREYLPGPAYRDTVVRYDTLHVPQVVRVPTPYPVREIIRESGARQQSLTEQKEVRTESREREAQTPVMVQALMLVCGVAVLGLVFVSVLTLLRK